MRTRVVQNEMWQKNPNEKHDLLKIPLVQDKMVSSSKGGESNGLWVHSGSQPFIYISIKSEVGCRDDTMPKTVDTARSESMQQSSATLKN